MQSLGNSIEKINETLATHTDCKIICITEHWKTEDQLKNLAINNFRLKSIFCRSQGKHGGSAIYVHKDINFKRNLKIEKLSKSGVCEMAAVEGNLGKADAVMVSIYRPPSTNIDDFLEVLEHTLTELFHEKRTLFVAGDLI